ncbi:MAG: Polysialic acid transport ATP-binding protein KpsT [Beijerinckiaceae bacterium]|nr:MAG: Polysialic acid transport ATP-binding protein KpsT [Beijerinckiaceae bacterium]
MSGRENVRFVARIYGQNVREVLDFVEDFSELGDYLDAPIKTYSSGMMARLAFGLSMAVLFDR